MHRQLELAEERQLPVVFHCVRRHEVLLRSVRDYSLTGGLMHGWTGSAEQLRGFLKKGFYISFGAALLRSPKVQRAAQQVPVERLLIESDAQPGCWAAVLQRISELRSLSVDEMQRLQAENFARLFAVEASWKS